jgi:hypothetical protein
MLWHADDIKVLHTDPQVIEEILVSLDEKYGIEAPLVVTCGKKCMNISA